MEYKIEEREQQSPPPAQWTWYLRLEELQRMGDNNTKIKRDSYTLFNDKTYKLQSSNYNKLQSS